MSRAGLSIAAIKDRLIDDITSIVNELAPGRGTFTPGPRGYVMRPNPRRSKDKPGSFVIWRNGAWKEYDAGESERGDIISLIAYCRNTDTAGALAWARDRIGAERMSDSDRRLADARARAKAEKAAKDAAASDEWKRNTAFRLWTEALPLQPGDLPTRYMRGRACPFEDVVGLSPSFRFAPRLAHPEGKPYPAMIARMIDRTGAVLAVHRTYLLEGAKGVSKAPVAKAKMVLAPTGGLFIPVSNGTLGDPFAIDPDERASAVAGPLMLTEGIEDGLTVAAAYADRRVWAAYSLSNMARLPVDLPFISDVIVAADNDVNAPAVAALARALEALSAIKPTSAVHPPRGHKDWNDFARAMVPRDDGE
jgi:hypothetical protein